MTLNGVMALIFHYFTEFDLSRLISSKWLTNPLLPYLTYPEELHVS